MSIGWPADAQARMVFATQLRQLNLDETHPAHLDGTAKTIYAATLTATNQTAEPLYVRFRRNTMTSKAQARVWQLATATLYSAAKHMLFCQP